MPTADLRSDIDICGGRYKIADVSDEDYARLVTAVRQLAYAEIVNIQQRTNLSDDEQAAFTVLQGRYTIANGNQATRADICALIWSTADGMLMVEPIEDAVFTAAWNEYAAIYNSIALTLSAARSSTSKSTVGGVVLGLCGIGLAFGASYLLASRARRGAFRPSPF